LKELQNHRARQYRDGVFPKNKQNEQEEMRGTTNTGFFSKSDRILNDPPAKDSKFLF